METQQRGEKASEKTNLFHMQDRVLPAGFSYSGGVNNAVVGWAAKSVFMPLSACFVQSWRWVRRGVM